MGLSVPLPRRATLSVVLVALAALGLGACGSDDGGTGAESERPPARSGAAEPRVDTVATGLEAPWAIAFLPDGRALITERPGAVRLLDRGQELQPEPVAEVEVEDVGEGGLLGIAVDPHFEDNGLVYLYRTVPGGNEVARYRLDGNRLEEQATILDGIPAGVFHNGGRIGFGPDDRLYIATGDAGEGALAQDRGSLAGKFLALDRGAYRGEGGRPEVVSLGHRNPQGFAWEPGTDRMLASEHGPTQDDEVNEIRPGRNYGWPEVQGAEHGEFTAPLRVYQDTTLAPSGAAFVAAEGSAWSGDFLVAALRGQQLRRYAIEDGEITGEEALYERDYGRLRTVVQGPDDALYVLTNNRDGRGSPAPDDDRVLRIVPPAG